MAQSPKPRSRGFHPLQDFKRIPRPNILGEAIPVIGPAWDAVGDLQDGHYGAAMLNAGIAGLEIIPAFDVLGELGQAGKITAKVGSKALSHRNVRNGLKALDKIHPGEEMHHIVPMKGASRTANNWKNNPLLVKALPQATHRRLHGKWDGLPKFGPVGQMWHGTNRVMKAGAIGLLGDVTDAGVAHVSQPIAAQHSAGRHKAK